MKDKLTYKACQCIPDTEIMEMKIENSRCVYWRRGLGIARPVPTIVSGRCNFCYHKKRKLNDNL